MGELAVETLLITSIVTVRDVYCRGSVADRSAEEHTATTQLVFPYRGVYVRHVGNDQAVAEANQALGAYWTALEGTARNPLAPTPHHWSHLLPLFLARRAFHFGTEPIAHYVRPEVWERLLQASRAERT